MVVRLDKIAYPRPSFSANVLHHSADPVALCIVSTDHAWVALLPKVVLFLSRARVGEVCGGSDYRQVSELPW